MPPRLPDAVEHVPLARLIPYARNARITHDDDQVAKIAASIVEFGWLNPVLVDDAGNVIAGHGRLLAAQKLGLDTIPVIKAAHLTPAQVRAYRLLDNRIVELGGWNEELLAGELHLLNEFGFDLVLTGFDEADLDRLMAPLDETGAAEGEDKAPEPPAEPVTRTGDLWLLGKHRLLCGDATNGANVARLFEGAKPHLLVRIHRTASITIRTGATRPAPPPHGRARSRMMIVPTGGKPGRCSVAMSPMSGTPASMRAR